LVEVSFGINPSGKCGEIGGKFVLRATCKEVDLLFQGTRLTSVSSVKGHGKGTMGTRGVVTGGLVIF
jgi:hypothetical protein